MAEEPTPNSPAENIPTSTDESNQSTPEGQAPVIVQTQQTWCVEMLMKGMTLENLSMLTGQSLKQLKPYIQRVKEKIAIEQAIQRDRDSQ